MAAQKYVTGWLIALLTTASAASGTTFYVSTSGNDAWDGLTQGWDGVHGPKATIQAAIQLTVDGDEVVMYPGIYRGAGNRDINFHGKAIRVRSINPDQNGIKDVTIVDCQGTESEYHSGFLFQSGEGHDSILSGITIMNGFRDYGGGIVCGNSSPVIEKCSIKNNRGYKKGGGLLCDNSDIQLIDCRIENNKAEGVNTDAPGGGMACSGGNPEIRNCVFTGNDARYGGGLYLRETGDKTLIVDCCLENNLCDLRGGGISFNSGAGVIEKCVINGNTVRFTPFGSAVYVEKSFIEMKQCIVSDNISGNSGGAIYATGNFTNNDTHLEIIHCSIVNNTRIGIFINFGAQAAVLRNSIVWENPQGLAGSLTVEYCDIQGGWPGVGNVNVDPLFADAAAGDFHLRSEGLRWDPGLQQWTWDEQTSACIDAGCPGSPLAEEIILTPFDPDFLYCENIRVNMGAYGGTDQASIGPRGWSLQADITNDGIVSNGDLLHLRAQWLRTGTPVSADFNRDGVVNSYDLIQLRYQWLHTTLWHNLF